MEGLASAEAHRFNYKYTTTYLELSCQWMFELLKIILTILNIICISLSKIQYLSETTSANANPVNVYFGNQYPNSFYQATAYYLYAINILILIFAFSIPLFYFTRADIFLGTGPWQRVLIWYNLIMWITIIPAIVLVSITIWRVNHVQIQIPAGRSVYFNQPSVDYPKFAFNGRNVGVPPVTDQFKDHEILFRLIVTLLVSTILLFFVFMGHLLVIPFKKNKPERDLNFYEYNLNDRQLYSPIGNEDRDLNDSLEMTPPKSEIESVYSNAYSRNSRASLQRTNKRLNQKYSLGKKIKNQAATRNYGESNSNMPPENVTINNQTQETSRFGSYDLDAQPNPYNNLNLNHRSYFEGGKSYGKNSVASKMNEETDRNLETDRLSDKTASIDSRDKNSFRI